MRGTAAQWFGPFYERAPKFLSLAILPSQYASGRACPSPPLPRRSDGGRGPLTEQRAAERAWQLPCPSSPALLPACPGTRSPEREAEGGPVHLCLSERAPSAQCSSGPGDRLVPSGDRSIHAAGPSVPREFVPVFSLELPKAGTLLPFLQIGKLRHKND